MYVIKCLRTESNMYRRCQLRYMYTCAARFIPLAEFFSLIKPRRSLQFSLFFVLLRTESSYIHVCTCNLPVEALEVDLNDTMSNYLRLSLLVLTYFLHFPSRLNMSI